MTNKSPWDNQRDHQDQKFKQHPHHDPEFEGENTGKIGRLLAFIFGLLLLILGLSLAFPSINIAEPYVIRMLLFAVIFGGAMAYWSRSSLARLMRAAGLWLFIALCASGFYLFKSDFGDRFLTALMPAQPSISDAGEIGVYRSQDGHFWINVGINETSVRMLVDTGASAIVLSRQDAIAAGLEPDKLDYDGTARTANGLAQFAQTRVAELRIGNRVFRDQIVNVNKAEMYGSLLGLSVLNKFAGYEVRGDRLILRP